jgi:hypothetical protein
MDSFLRLQARQILELLGIVDDRQFIVEVGAIADNQHLADGPAVPLQQTAEAFQVLLDGGHVGGAPRQGGILQGDEVIARGGHPRLDFLFVRRGIVGEAIVHDLAVRVSPLHHKSGEIVEQETHVNVETHQGLIHNVQPNFAFVCGDGIERAPEAIVVEFGGGQAEGVDQHGLGEPIRHLVQRARRGEPIEDEHQRHCPVVHLGRRGAIAVDDLAHLENLQERIQDRKGTQVAAQLSAREPIHQRRHGERAVERQAGETRRPNGAVVKVPRHPPGMAEAEGAFAPASLRPPGKEGTARVVVGGNRGEEWRLVGHGMWRCRSWIRQGQATAARQRQKSQEPKEPHQDLRPTGFCGRVHGDAPWEYVELQPILYHKRGVLSFLPSIRLLRCEI